MASTSGRLRPYSDWQKWTFFNFFHFFFEIYLPRGLYLFSGVFCVVYCRYWPKGAKCGNMQLIKAIYLITLWKLVFKQLVFQLVAPPGSPPAESDRSFQNMAICGQARQALFFSDIGPPAVCLPVRGSSEGSSGNKRPNLADVGNNLPIKASYLA